MRKPFNHTELSGTMCEHDNCAMVNGREGNVRRRIKKNVISRVPLDSTKRVLCYPCSQYMKTGMTLREQRIARGGRVEEDNTSTMQAGA